MWLLSLFFAAALIGLGSLIIQDLPSVDKPLRLESFIDQVALNKVNTQRTKLRNEVQGLQRSQQDASDAYNSAAADYNSAKATFDNWIETRTATQQQEQDPEVIARVRNVEALKTRQRESLANLQRIQTETRQTNLQLQDANTERARLQNGAQPAFDAARRSQVFKVFLMRLALTLPLLLVAGYFVAKKRKSSYWPLYRGFVLFALFAFFVELVPYLPSYGGYIRFIVGIALVVVVGHYAIRAMGRYMERKKQEESRSESERRNSIQYETALKKIAAKTCPGCDRAINKSEGASTFFCVHCGIRLREKCGSCGETNLTFHRFCLSCGDATKSMSEREPPQAENSPA